MGPGRLTLTNPVPIPRSPGLRAAALALALPDAGDGGRHGGRVPGPARSCAAPCICLPGMVAPVVAWPAGGFNSTPRGQGDGDLSSERVARRKTAGDVRAFCVAGLRHVCVRSIGWGDHGSCTCLTVVCSRAPSKVKKNEHPACILPLLFFFLPAYTRDQHSAGKENMVTIKLRRPIAVHHNKKDRGSVARGSLRRPIACINPTCTKQGE